MHKPLQSNNKRGRGISKRDAQPRRGLSGTQRIHASAPQGRARWQLGHLNGPPG